MVDIPEVAFEVKPVYRVVGAESFRKYLALLLAEATEGQVEVDEHLSELDGVSHAAGAAYFSPEVVPAYVQHLQLAVSLQPKEYVAACLFIELVPVQVELHQKGFVAEQPLERLPSLGADAVAAEVEHSESAVDR